MKITGIETHVLVGQLERQSFGWSQRVTGTRQAVLCSITTDTGLEGVGEAFYFGGPTMEFLRTTGAPVCSESPGTDPARHTSPLTAVSGAPDTPPRPGDAAGQHSRGCCGTVALALAEVAARTPAGSPRCPRKQIPITSLSKRKLRPI